MIRGMGSHCFLSQQQNVELNYMSQKIVFKHFPCSIAAQCAHAFSTATKSTSSNFCYSLHCTLTPSASLWLLSQQNLHTAGAKWNF